MPVKLPSPSTRNQQNQSPSSDSRQSLSAWRRLLPHGLHMRLALPFVLLIVLVLVSLAVFLGKEARGIYMNRLETELHNQATLLADEAGRGMTGSGGNADVVSIVHDLSTLIPSRLTIIDGSGKVIADSEADPATMQNHASRPEVIQARASGNGEAERRSVTVDRDFLYLAVPIRQVPGAVARVAVPISDVDDVVQRVQRSIAIAAGIAILIAIPMALAMSARISRPLEHLREQASEVADGDLSVRVEPDGTREIGDLGRSFNSMIAELQASRETIERTGVRLESVMAGLQDGVILTDADGRVVRLNRAAERMLETTERAAEGRPYMQVSRDHQLAKQLREALAGDQQADVTIDYGLDRKVLQATASLIQGESERLGLIVLRDITRLRQLEMMRRDFVANVSHELRTPLTSIRALTETLEAGAIDDPELTDEFLSRILGEVDRLTALVEDLLDMARLEAGRSPLDLQIVDPGELVQRGADRLRPQVERARLTLTVEVGQGLVPISVDRSRIEQVLINLVHNAIKFTPPGGKIIVRVEREGRFITTTVEDTGVGISVADQTRIFERFYKSDKARHSEGTGLGLAIAKHIVQLHGGQISLESKSGEGARFRFSLPIDGEVAAAHEASEFGP